MCSTATFAFHQGAVRFSAAMPGLIETIDLLAQKVYGIRSYANGVFRNRSDRAPARPSST